MGLVVSVCGNTLVGFFVFLLCFFELHGVDLDPILGVVEGEIECEGVGRGDIATFGVLGEGSEFGAGERLQGAVQLCRGCDGYVSREARTFW